MLDVGPGCSLHKWNILYLVKGYEFREFTAMQYLYLMLLLEFIYSLYLFILRIPTTFGAVAFPVHAVIFNKYWQGELVFVVCVFEVEDILRERNVVVRARWTGDIGLDSSVVEHLNSDSGVPVSIPCPAKYSHLYFFVFVHTSHP